MASTLKDVYEDRYGQLDQAPLSEVPESGAHSKAVEPASDIPPSGERQLSEPNELALNDDVATLPPSFFEDELDRTANIEPIQERVTRSTIRALRRPIERPFVTPHHKDNPKVHLTLLENGERAVIAKEDIKAGEIIAVFTGPMLSADRISELPAYQRDHVVQVSEKDYIYNENGLAELINHSCSPNCGIKNLVEVVAMRDIAAGEELTWDYEMTENSDWEMQQCQCGNDNCRGKIRAYKFMPEDVRTKYGEYVSEWLTKEKEVIDPKKLHIETITAAEITPETIQELADLFIEIFCNEWPEYIFCPDCDSKTNGNMRLSAAEVYKNSRPIPLTILKHNPMIPPCPCCGGEMELFLHPDKVREHLEKLFEKDAWLVVMRTAQEKIVGFAYGYQRTIKEVFEEEWGTIFPYAKIATEKNPRRDYATFLAKMKEIAEQKFPDQTPVNDETKLIPLNMIAFHPQARSAGNSYKLGASMNNAIPPQSQRQLMVAEALFGSITHTMAMQAGASEIQGVMQEEKPQPEKDDYIIVTARVSDITARFTQKK